MPRLPKKVMLTAILCSMLIVAQSIAQDHDDDEKPQNLKVLPKNISHRELHTIMKNYSISLGVKCGFRHVSEKVEGQARPKFDFASDNKPEKKVARDMMRMTAAINENYIGKMIGGDHTLEQINCVTCHMGRKTPVNTLDSLKMSPPTPEKH